MALTVRDTKLETRAARLRLSIRPEPYWRTLEKGLALGYRRRANGGTWLARRRTATGAYVEHKTATADDLQDADGVAVLDYGQAQQARGSGGGPSCGGMKAMKPGPGLSRSRGDCGLSEGL